MLYIPTSSCVLYIIHFISNHDTWIVLSWVVSLHWYSHGPTDKWETLRGAYPHNYHQSTQKSENNLVTPRRVMTNKNFPRFSTRVCSIDFFYLPIYQILTGRQSKFKTLKIHNTKVGLNSLANRLYYINDLIPLSWLNLTIDSFEVHCKKLFLTCREIWSRIPNRLYFH